MSNENGGTGDDLKFNLGDSINGYKLVHKIDEGGFGQVFKVTNNENKTFAMKIESNSQSGGSAIKLELDVLKDLMGETVFPSFIIGGKRRRYHYLVLELLGDNLRMLKMKSEGDVFTYATWSRVAIQCLYAVKVLHNKGFLHRDIKPSNFAIAENPTGGLSRRIVLFDFGLARRYVKKNDEGPLVKAKVNVAGEKVVAEKKETTKKATANEKKGGTTKTNKKKDRRKAAMDRKSKEDPQNGNKKMSKETVSNNKIKVSTKATKKLEEEKRKQINLLYKFRVARPRTDFRGTYQYASPNAHRLLELGRQDDIWSLLYMIVDLFLQLPWTGEDEEKVKGLKTDSPLDRLFNDPCQPNRLTDEMKQNLGKIQEMLEKCNYYSHPNYVIVHDFFLAVMKKEKVDWQDPYDWEKAKHSPDQLKDLVKNREIGQWENATEFFKENKWDGVETPSNSQPKQPSREAVDEGQSRMSREFVGEEIKKTSLSKEAPDDIRKSPTIRKSVMGDGKKRMNRSRESPLDAVTPLSGSATTPTPSKSTSKDGTPSKEDPMADEKQSPMSGKIEPPKKSTEGSKR